MELWEQKRSAKLREQRQAEDGRREAEEECTFRPQIGRTAQQLRPAQAVVDRLQDWGRAKDARQSQRAQQRGEAELEECTFRPSISEKGKRSAGHAETAGFVRLCRETEHERVAPPPSAASVRERQEREELEYKLRQAKARQTAAERAAVPHSDGRGFTGQLTRPVDPPLSYLKPRKPRAATSVSPSPSPEGPGSSGGGAHLLLSSGAGAASPPPALSPTSGMLVLHHTHSDAHGDAHDDTARFAPLPHVGDGQVVIGGTWARLSGLVHAGSGGGLDSFPPPAGDAFAPLPPSFAPPVVASSLSSSSFASSSFSSPSRPSIRHPSSTHPSSTHPSSTHPSSTHPSSTHSTPASSAGSATASAAAPAAVAVIPVEPTFIFSPRKAGEFTVASAATSIAVPLRASPPHASLVVPTPPASSIPLGATFTIAAAPSHPTVSFVGRASPTGGQDFGAPVADFGAANSWVVHETEAQRRKVARINRDATIAHALRIERGRSPPRSPGRQ
jgi:hypothetical protein